jgi:MFS family permease
MSNTSEIERIEVDKKAYSKFTGKMSLILGSLIVVGSIICLLSGHIPHIYQAVALFGIAFIFPIFFLIYENWVSAFHSKENSVELRAFKQKSNMNDSMKLNIWFGLVFVLTTLLFVLSFMVIVVLQANFGIGAVGVAMLTFISCIFVIVMSLLIMAAAIYNAGCILWSVNKLWMIKNPEHVIKIIGDVTDKKEREKEAIDSKFIRVIDTIDVKNKGEEE